MFKDSFKYYKTKASLPDLSGVIDIYDLNKFGSKVQVFKNKNFSANSECVGLIPFENWDIYEIKEKPGLIYIKNPFTPFGQRYWTIQCLENYTKKPNKLNLDPFNEIPPGENWWEFCEKYKNYHLLKKLRWATLGYHHNWDTKVYTEDFRNEFPQDLGLLSKTVANVIGYDYFEPQAAIVNFYHLDSTLSGHTDHSEINLEAPLISFSFGQSAIFLLGGKTLEEKPTPLFIHSGDIIIMTKETRLCYHGIPRILKTDKAPWNISSFSEEKIANVGFFSDQTILKSQNEELWQPFGQYLNNSRINMNVRQVLPSGQNFL